MKQHRGTLWIERMVAPRYGGRCVPEPESGEVALVLCQPTFLAVSRLAGPVVYPALLDKPAVAPNSSIHD